jgi:hypothetical protein
MNIRFQPLNGGIIDILNLNNTEKVVFISRGHRLTVFNQHVTIKLC